MKSGSYLEHRQPSGLRLPMTHSLTPTPPYSGGRGRLEKRGTFLFLRSHSWLGADSRVDLGCLTSLHCPFHWQKKKIKGKKKKLWYFLLH